MTLAPGTKLGPYEILAPIGAGGMGEVYCARDPRVGRDVAIKVSSEQFSDRFAREIHAVASLNHSNVCTLYDVGPNYLVMELVEGPTLADRIRQGPIPLDESLEIAKQIADALEAAHEKGIVHRDLKPGNIKLRPDGTVKVLDFGLAKVEEAAAISLETSPTLSVAQTAAGVMLGTAAYMSPEQARGKNVDKRCDIWSFGVVLYEMLTGKQLFSGETVSDTLAAALTKEPDWEEVPAKTRLLLRRCLEKDPKNRLRDIGDAMPLLEGFSESVSEKRVWPWLAVAGVLFVALAAISYVHFLEKTSIEEAISFQIPFPDKMNPGIGGPVLSPNGRYLAFPATGSDGISRIWIRPLNSLEARYLPGTEFSHTPPFFWSADSRHLTFSTRYKLKKVDVSGGAAQSLCDLPNYAVGGSWNRDGVIIFGSNQWGDGIMRVSEEGTATALTKPNQERQEWNHTFPAFLPDGRHFLYFSRSRIPEKAGIYVGMLGIKPEEQSSRQVLSTPTNAIYVPPRESVPGQLLFMREHALMAQEFDEEHQELLGEPIRLADNIASSLEFGLFSASHNGVLAYKSGAISSTGAAWVDRLGKSLGRIWNPGLYYGFTLSPDGTRAAFGWHSLSTLLGIVDIWQIDLSSGTPLRLTFEKGHSMMPIWSPDGKSIIFSSNLEGAFNLCQMPASGGGTQKWVLKSSASKFATSWSSDGKFVLYTEVNPKTKADLWILPLGANPIPLLNTNFRESDGCFSPDMRWIAYVSDETGTDEVFVRAFSHNTDSASFGASPKWIISKGGGTAPRWARNGKELYYMASDWKVMATAISTDPVFRPAEARILFQSTSFVSAASYTINTGPWDMAQDGSRFIVPLPAADGTPSPFTIILNWTSLLKK